MIPITRKFTLSLFFMFFFFLEMFTDYILAPRIVTFYSQSQLESKDSASVLQNVKCLKHAEFSKRLQNSEFLNLETINLILFLPSLEGDIKCACPSASCQSSFTKFRILVGFKFYIERDFRFVFFFLLLKINFILRKKNVTKFCFYFKAIETRCTINAGNIS